MWDKAVQTLGGRPGTAGDLAARYAEPHRAYHDTDHVLAVARDVADLAAHRTERDRAVLTLAALAHDVVYDGRPGEDERNSAEWVRERLEEAGVDPEPVVALVLATIDHTATDELTALLMDADLAILAADPEAYERYRQAVRREYAHVTDEAWRAGRGQVLESLHERDPLYRTPRARARWEARAKANLAAELAGLSELR
ncbi:putative metal-dependent HD superfamily phosphohydrolase [Saccharothrix variisporea]|uniref:Putative metal-dependent HD superfamily phosphohydrolase n=1 Tax=Saccharothrix variisporea TaxID=543527 RepID=A0A495XCS3_9PSEU|nr:putative metal-dependent HD superfamily phosphohydrolase [Saccharothrix variisporea]